MLQLVGIVSRFQLNCQRADLVFLAVPQLTETGEHIMRDVAEIAMNATEEKRYEVPCDCLDDLVQCVCDGLGPGGRADRPGDGDGN